MTSDPRQSTARAWKLVGAADPADVPESLSRYTVLREVGRGGGGIVYEATDPVLKRRVALKVLRENHVNEEDLKRFAREATAVAKLRHPNIVAVYDAGQAASPFIAMEWIEGAPLALHKLPLHTRIQLLATVADAVQHAHSHGIVHRDLKPGNILVDGAGEPHLVDFGLAHVSELSRMTGAGVALGTPLYMAPEQVRGESDRIGPATDVYALGVLLYEALSGSTPFKADRIQTVYRRILDEEPQPVPGCAPDLNTIALKALEKEPDRRYASAADFAGDLRRWLSGEAILAHPPSLASRALKWARRRKPVLAVSAAAALAVCAVSLILLGRARQQEREFRARERELETHQQELKELGALWTNLLLAQRDLHVRAADPAQVRASITTAVDRVSDYLRNHPGHPQAWYVRARGLYVLDRLDEADADLRRAVEIAPDFAPGLALRGQVRLEQYYRLFVQTATRRAAPGDHPLLRGAVEDLRASAAQGAERTSVARWGLSRTREDDEAVFLAGVSWLYHVEKKGREALARLGEEHARRPSADYAFQLAQLSNGLDEKIRWTGEAIELRPHFATAYTIRATCWHRKGDLERAIADYTAAVRINPELTTAYINRGVARRALGRDADALADYDAALEVNPRLAVAWVNRGNLHCDAKRDDAAKRDCDEALRLDPDLAEGFLLRGRLRTGAQDFDGAIADFESCIRLDPKIGVAHMNRAILLLFRGRLDEAIAGFDAALAEEPHLVEARYHRARAFARQKKTERAIEDLDEVLRKRPAWFEARLDRANARTARRDFQGAFDDFDEAVRLRPASYPALAGRAQALEALGRLEAALRDAREAQRLAPPDWPPYEALAAMVRRLEQALKKP